LLRIPTDVANESFDILYAAHTASCTFLLDADGVCRRIVMGGGGKRRDASKTAVRCVGAQYVASLDPAVPGCLVEMPRAGVAMMFARVDERGRISLVRTGVVTRFESKQKTQDPFVSEEIVATSAPEMAPKTLPAKQRPHPDSRVPTARDPYDAENPIDRTQRIHALRPEQLVRAAGLMLADSDPDPDVDHRSALDDSDEMKTAEWESSDGVPDETPSAGRPRKTWPSKLAPSQRPERVGTLRKPHVQMDPVDDEDGEDPYVEQARGMLPRRADTTAPPLSERTPPRSFRSGLGIPRPQPEQSERATTRRQMEGPPALGDRPTPRASEAVPRGSWGGRPPPRSRRGNGG
jgi:hypothetical protein